MMSISPFSTIVYEDLDIIVFAKPPGLVVNTAPSNHSRSLQDLMRAYLHLPSYTGPPLTAQASWEDIFLERAGMVHRLDKDTSGFLVWAKNPPALRGLLHQFKTRSVTKIYRGLVHGIIKQPAGRINFPLGRKKTNRKIMAVDPMGRSALTDYKVQHIFTTFNAVKLKNNYPQLKQKVLAKLYQGFSLLEVYPKTGRTHQIRAHFTAIHHPLVGDTAYLPKNKARLDPLWCPRQFLDASQLEFIHPITQKNLGFQSATLPTDLTQALTFLTSRGAGL
jgi:23S rRNA pseudouridine1911/1915/1917 synthase